MCGRFVSATPPDRLAAHFGAERVSAGEPGPDYNVTPRSPVPTVRVDGGRRLLERARWGLVPPWAPSVAVGDRLINARSETAPDRPAFREAFAHRRCLVPADAFYEWRAGPGRRKQPVAVRRRDGRPMAFAGLWEVWHDPGDPSGGVVRSCTILTTTPNALLAPVHDRMPVLLGEEGWDAWLDPSSDPGGLRALLVPAPDDLLEAFPVRTLVNDPRRNGPELLEPAEPVAMDELPLEIPPR
ncbi:MAG: SOS response-associated peptidase [Acidimicrobiia bacterium]|nr:SOS response-associated peptidase [Acidimicrobiia bacterium]